VAARASRWWPFCKPQDKTRFMVHLITQANLGTMEERAYASQSDRRAAVMNRCAPRQRHPGTG
jgi:hypothetical protein